MRYAIDGVGRLAIVSVLTIGLAACASHEGPGRPAMAEPTARYDAAIAHYEMLYRENPGNIEALIGLSRSLRHAGRGEDAVDVLRDARKSLGADAAYLSELGKAHLVAGDPEDAQDALAKAVEQDKTDWQAFAALGVANDLTERHGEAAMAYQSALGLCPDSATILNNLALSEGLSGNVAESISLLTKASQIQPHSKRIRQNLTAFQTVRLNCPGCDARDYAQLARAIYPQDWAGAAGGPSCGNDVASAAAIASALDEQSFVDMRVHFAFDSDVLTPEAKEALDQLALAMVSDTLIAYRFRLEGHTDAVGTEAYNQDLSTRRAAAVERYLTETHKIDARRLDSTGFGESRLADPTHPNDGVNRRVRVVKTEPMPEQPVAGL